MSTAAHEPEVQNILSLSEEIMRSVARLPPSKLMGKRKGELGRSEIRTKAIWTNGTQRQGR